MLVCEDDPAVRLLLRLSVEPLGHRVIEARDGSAAILLARSTQPDLIVVDTHPPDLPGIDVVRAIRAMPGLDETPIVMTDGTTRVEALVVEIEERLENAVPKEAGLRLRRLH